MIGGRWDERLVATRYQISDDLRDRYWSLALAIACGFVMIIKVIFGVVATLLGVVAVRIVVVVGRMGGGLRRLMVLTVEPGCRLGLRLHHSSSHASCPTSVRSSTFNGLALWLALMSRGLLLTLRHAACGWSLRMMMV